jgi:hypothetical protein
MDEERRREDEAPETMELADELVRRLFSAEMPPQGRVELEFESGRVRVFWKHGRYPRSETTRFDHV